MATMTYFILFAIWVALFARLEAEIEGTNGWAAEAPTARWHWDGQKLTHRLFNQTEWTEVDHTTWPGNFFKFYITAILGGKDFTGYHRVVDLIQLFISHVLTYAIFYGHDPIWLLELRAIAFIMLVWSVEDTLFFIVNPAYGWKKFNPTYVTWHKEWVKIGEFYLGDKGILILFAEGALLMAITFTLASIIHHI